MIARQMALPQVNILPYIYKLVGVTMCENAGADANAVISNIRICIMRLSLLGICIRICIRKIIAVIICYLHMR
jgi:hypothetical protein